MSCLLVQKLKCMKIVANQRFVVQIHPIETIVFSSNRSTSSSIRSSNVVSGTHASAAANDHLHNSIQSSCWMGRVQSIHTSSSTTLTNSNNYQSTKTNVCHPTIRQRNGCAPMVTVRWKNKASNKVNQLGSEASDKKSKKKDKPAGGGKLESSQMSSKIETNNANAVDEDDDDHVEEEHDETILPDPKKIKDQMMKHVTSYEQYLKSVRNGVPGPEFFDNILVNAYDDPATPILSVAQIVLVSTTRATATCFDPALTNNVVTAIRDKLQLNPTANDIDGTIDIPIPRISMEERIEITTVLKKRTENYRNRIRTVRRKALDIVKNGVAGKLEHISKDDAFRVQKEIESLADTIILKINTLADKKLNDIMTV